MMGDAVALHGECLRAKVDSEPASILLGVQDSNRLVNWPGSGAESQAHAGVGPQVERHLLGAVWGATLAQNRFCLTSGRSPSN
jgi:hypothetical protein